MRALIQRVSKASVYSGSEEISSIKNGMLVLLGVCKEDSELDAERISSKILSARIFEDENGKMSRSIEEVDGEILAVSQITLYGSLKKGNKPDFGKSANSQDAKRLFDLFVRKLTHKTATNIKEGVFGATMNIELVNAGPVTFMIDSRG